MENITEMKKNVGMLYQELRPGYLVNAFTDYLKNTSQRNYYNRYNRNYNPNWNNDKNYFHNNFDIGNSYNYGRQYSNSKYSVNNITKRKKNNDTYKSHISAENSSIHQLIESDNLNNGNKKLEKSEKTNDKNKKILNLEVPNKAKNESTNKQTCHKPNLKETEKLLDSQKPEKSSSSETCIEQPKGTNENIQLTEEVFDVEKKNQTDIDISSSVEFVENETLQKFEVTTTVKNEVEEANDVEQGVRDISLIKEEVKEYSCVENFLDKSFENIVESTVFDLENEKYCTLTNESNLSSNLQYNCLENSKENYNNNLPKISLVPLSFLLENIPSDIEEIESTSNLDSLSQKLVNKVAKMDKICIKNIINNPGTKFDNALKLKARQRLRDEIRKQLKTLQQQQGENSDLVKIGFEPDEAIDAKTIPQSILDQIKTAFGIEFLEEMAKESASVVGNDEELVLTTAITAATSILNELPLMDTSKEVPETEPMISQAEDLPKPDLMQKLKNMELLKNSSEKFIKSLRSKNASKSETSNSPGQKTRSLSTPGAEVSNVSSPKIKTKSSQSESSVKPLKNDEIETLVIDSSSSSSSSESSSDSDSSSSSSSASSTCSSYKRRKKRRRILERNVIQSFKRLILPNLSTYLRKKYDEKYSKTTNNSLSFIYDVCLNKLLRNSNLGQYEKKVLKKNLKACNNEEALIFLQKNIKELYDQERKKIEKAADSKIKVAPIKKIDINNIEIDANMIASQLKLIAQQITEKRSLFSSNEAIKHCAEGQSNEKLKNFVDEKSKNEISKDESIITIVTDSPNKSVDKKITDVKKPSSCERNLLQTNDTDKLQKSDIGSFNKDMKNGTANGNVILNSKILENDDKETQGNLHKYSPFYKLDCKNNKEKIKDLASSDSSSELPKGGKDNLENSESFEMLLQQRLWKSPGEKKLISNKGTLDSNNKNTNENCILSNDRSLMLSSYHTVDTYRAIQQLDSLRLQSLMQKTKFDEAVLSNLKEIDLKLMGLHKRKMYVEEMILKLQKDKMDIDLATMQLQNERFLIISTASSKGNLNGINSTFLQPPVKSEPHVEYYSKLITLSSESSCDELKSPKPITKRKHTPEKSPLPSEKRWKKRGQSDILIENTKNSVSANDTNRSKILLKSTPKVILENCDAMFNNHSQRSSRRHAKRLELESKNNSIKNSKNKKHSNIKSVPQQPNDEDNFNCEYKVDEYNTGEVNIENGSLEGFKSPITQIRLVAKYILASSEDSCLYKFDWRTKELVTKFTKHTETITQFVVDSKHEIYTISLDGYFKKTSLENFGLETQSVNFKEPLQSITVDFQSNLAYFGSRWGNIFTFNLKTNKPSETALCSVDSSVMAMLCSREGPRKILIIAAKGNELNIRDATTGLLLRNIEVSVNQNIYSILLSGSTLYCGTNKNEIILYDFTTGNLITTMQCGNGAISMKFYKEKYIFVGCYDSFVYILDKDTGTQIGRFGGSGHIITAIEIAGKKIISSAKNNTLEIMDIPSYVE